MHAGARQLVEVEQVALDQPEAPVVARAGQEPTFHGNFTLTPDGMARLGLRQVEAPPDYGTPAFCERRNASEPRLRLHCIAVTDQMLAYEEKRRRLGEQCAADGTLYVSQETR